MPLAHNSAESDGFLCKPSVININGFIRLALIHQGLAERPVDAQIIRKARHGVVQAGNGPVGFAVCQVRQPDIAVGFGEIGLQGQGFCIASQGFIRPIQGTADFPKVVVEGRRLGVDGNRLVDQGVGQSCLPS